MERLTINRDSLLDYLEYFFIARGPSVFLSLAVTFSLSNLWYVLV